MSDKVGEMAWLDLTVANATEVQGFYQKVIGWQAEETPVSDHHDYTMKNPVSGDAVSGICHAKGINADMPAAWLPYFLVANISDSIHAVSSQGGELITDIKLAGKDQYIVIKDPAGAVCALYQKG
jgi:predicted enzyme related to lactoylglutathione lyase